MLFPVISALLLAFSFSTSIFPWFVFVGFIPLFFFLDKSSFKSAFWGSFLFGFIFFAFTTRWMLEISIPNWAQAIELSYFEGYLIVGLVWLLLSFVAALLAGVFGLSWRYASGIRQFTLVPSAWILTEYMRSWAIAFLFTSPQTLLGPHWTFGSLGYVFAYFPWLLPSAKFLGLYGASFVIIMVNVALYKALAKKGKKEILGTMLVILFVMLLLGYGFFQIAKDSSRIKQTKEMLLVQTATGARPLAPEEVPLFMEERVALLREAAAFDPDVVLLPESSSISGYYGEKTSEFLKSIFGTEKSRIIVDSSKAFAKSGKGVVQRVYFYDPLQGLVGVSEKKLLMPFGEYLPDAARVLAQAFGLENIVKRFEEYRSLQRGIRFEEREEGVLLCSAVFAPSLWRDLSFHSGLLVNAANQTDFRGSSLFSQTEMTNRFLAASNDRWFAQIADNGPSYIIDNLGRIREKISFPEERILQSNVEYRHTLPLAMRLGDWPVFAAFGIFAFNIIVALPRKWYLRRIQP